MFSPKAMVQFEVYITRAICTLGRQIDSLIDTGKGGDYLSWTIIDGDVRSRARPGEAAIDAASWAAFLAFDIIGDLVSRTIRTPPYSHEYL